MLCDTVVSTLEYLIDKSNRIFFSSSIDINDCVRESPHPLCKNQHLRCFSGMF